MWEHQILLESKHGMGGLAIGDLDSASTGNEVVTVNDAGEVWMVAQVDSTWKPELIHKGKGELIMCAVGDVDSRSPGKEFVGVGMVRGGESPDGPGQVLMLRKHDRRWIAESVFQDSHALHGVAVGDVSAKCPGNEIVACGFNHRVHLVYLDDDEWCAETIYVGNNRLKIAAVGDVLPEREGMEVLVCGSDGNVVALWEGKLGWCHEVVFSDRAGQSRIAHRGSKLLSGGDMGKVTLIRRENRQWQPEFVARDTGKIRGTVIADLDPAHAGVELYVCGYSRNVSQIVQDENGLWRSRTIFVAERPLHHLVAGDIDPSHSGEELITCGHEGKLIALWAER
jgi:hypothetical protein